MHDLKNLTCLVTGASRGIGRAIALAMADAGANVLINYRNSDALAAEVVKEIQDRQVQGKAYKADIGDRPKIQAMIESILTDFGGVDILVNNAAVNRDRSFLKMTAEDWETVVRVNLNGTFHVTHALVPHMIEKKWGRIINISSMGGQTGNFGQANYTATKAALFGFSKTLAKELARKGITVNSVAPGFTKTDMTGGIPEKVAEQIVSTIPLGRMAEPEEIAHAAVFLAGRESGYITGSVINVNGGLYMM